MFLQSSHQGGNLSSAGDGCLAVTASCRENIPVPYIYIYISVSYLPILSSYLLYVLSIYRWKIYVCVLAATGYLHTSDEVFMQKLACHFVLLMSSCHGDRCSALGGIMATDYSLSYQGQHPGKVLWSWHFVVCEGVFVSTFLFIYLIFFLTEEGQSTSLQWWRVTELWYLSLPGDSLILRSLALHSSSAWHS